MAQGHAHFQIIFAAYFGHMPKGKVVSDFQLIALAFTTITGLTASQAACV